MIKNYRNGTIDILKLISILLVIIFHFLYEFSFNNNLRVLGFIGISLFFIISGYLLAKKYPEIETFSFKWLSKRIVRIISIYYPALIILIIIFGKQIYSGSVIKNLGFHFLFIDFASWETAYGIISTAWFFVPLIGLYFLYPYLNSSIKKNNYFIIIAFFIAIVVRLVEQSFTSYSFSSALFFLAEFCFGILYAINKKNLKLLFALSILIVNPVMIIPFIIFYFAMFVKINSNKLLCILSTNTLAIFLLHEAFIKIMSGRWKIINLNKTGSIILLLVITILLSYFSNFIYSVYNRKINKDNKSLKEK